MNYNELNVFIERYAKQYKTQTAVLLTGEWGSGKSYYINNELRPYLKEKKIKCVVVSLFGVDNIADLSKQIYLNLRAPSLLKKSETREVLSIVGRNIINNTLFFNGINIGISDNDLKKLYESVDIKDVLIVMEDVERSAIDIIKLLGFVNGLVEYDGAKVLLVANETEILKSVGAQKSKSDHNDSTVKEDVYEITSLDDSAIGYEKIKEKTIGDTIQFMADINESVRSILKDYSGAWVKALNDSKEIESISGILGSRCNLNLRVLKYALQKCNDIFSEIEEENDFKDVFYIASFEGMLIIANRFIRSDIPVWEGSEYISARLGSASSPVFRFVYDYLKWNTINPDDIIAAAKDYENYRYFDRYETNNTDSDLYIISNYYIHTEKEVLKALINIEHRLRESDFVGIYAYERIGYLAIKAGEIVGYNADNLCSIMIDKACKMCGSQHLSSRNIIHGIYVTGNDSKDVQEQYSSFIKSLSESIDGRDDYIDFSYNPKDIHDIYESACRNKQPFIVNHKFISRFELTRLVSMIKKCSSKQINDFRGLLFVFYRSVYKNEYDSEDVKFLEQFVDRLETDFSPGKRWDKIQYLQLDFLKSNIKEFIEQMK